MTTLTAPQQLPLTGLPPASFIVHIRCGKCGHHSDLQIDFQMLRNLFRLRCGDCGGRGRDLEIGQRFGGLRCRADVKNNLVRG